MPKIYIFAGPNGAGKTTLAQEYLPNEGNVIQFINADMIAKGISPFAPETAGIASGRAMLKRIDELVAQRLDFALETTLAGTWLVNRITEWQSRGYSVHLCYVHLTSADLAVARVKNRVESGGHNISEPIIRRRFVRSLHLLESKYKDLVDTWMEYDNSGGTPNLIDEKL